MPSNIIRTAIGTVGISDSIVSLMCDNYLTADVNAAAQHFPYFKFDPVRDKDFYQYSWWGRSHDIRVDGATRIHNRFKSWYNNATVMERVFISIAALTDSYDQIDNIIFSAYSRMKDDFFIIMQDSDDTHFIIDDYNAMRSEDNLNAAIFTDQLDWWILRFEEQMHRVISTPCIPWDQFTRWNNMRDEQERFLAQHFRSYKNLLPNRAARKKGRRIFNRSLRLFTRMYGCNTASKFLRGKNLWIHGKHFVWKLKLAPGDIMHDTITPSEHHTPFGIQICDHQMNRLCCACVLFPDTPVLDQAVAFGLMIATEPDELGFLRKANLFSFTPAGRENDLLRSMPNARIPTGDIPTVAELIEAADNNLWRVPEDTTIDDGRDPNVEDEDREWGTSYSRHESYLTRFLGEPPPDSDYATAFSSEYDEPIISLVSGTPLTIEQRNNMLELQNMWRTENRQERYWRSKHPIMSRLREKLLSRLDVDPVILRYMQFPEFHFHFLPRVLSAPRLERWVSTRVPLFEKEQ
jgi:hypothetical protein